MPPSTLLPLSLLQDAFPGFGDLAGQLARSSLIEYRRDASLYLAWCGFDRMRVMNPQQLIAWRTFMVDHTTLSPNTINRRLAAIKRLVRASAEAMGPQVAYGFVLVAGVKPSALRHRLRGQRRLRLAPQQVRRLCQSPHPRTLMGLRDQALLATLAGSGCRISSAHII